MSQRGFAGPGTGRDRAMIGNLQRQISDLKSQLAHMTAVSAMNLEKMKSAFSELLKVREELEVYKHFTAQLFDVETGQSRFPFLMRHVRNLGHNFPSENIPIFLQISQCGEGTWRLLVQHLGFPSWREIQRWRGSFLDENGINSELLNGEISKLHRIFSTYFGTGYETVNPRVVLAVDAAGVSPRVVVHKNGDVDGFLNSNARVSPEDATRLRDSWKDIQRFVQDHQSDIVRDFFVVFA